MSSKFRHFLYRRVRLLFFFSVCIWWNWLLQVTCLFFVHSSDSRHHRRTDGHEWGEVGQGRIAPVVPDEDGWLSECQRSQLHNELARWTCLQCAHPQAQVRQDVCRHRAATVGRDRQTVGLWSERSWVQLQPRKVFRNSLGQVVNLNLLVADTVSS